MPLAGTAGSVPPQHAPRAHPPLRVDFAQPSHPFGLPRFSRSAAMATHLDTLREIIDSFSAAYVKTPAKLKILDAFSVCALTTAVLQVRSLPRCQWLPSAAPGCYVASSVQ